ncbi:hypothetical protein FACS189473_3480 [Spirochaetia bacterium]|nr:hypothetical protein FACS189473_3480 [Spirochaetia bacterium]
MIKGAALLVLTLAAGTMLLAGCSKSKASAAKTLEIWHIQNVDPFPTIVQDSVGRFIADNPDFKVNVSIIANDAYKQKIAVAASSGQLPDVFISWSGGTMYEYADAGAIAARVAGGRIPPVKGLARDDPILLDLLSRVQQAPDMQFWYDQSMNAEVAEVHKATSQEVFGNTMTPEAASKQWQEAQAAFLKR